MAQYFTAYRIDHVLGFFRIWEIPGECTTGKFCAYRIDHVLGFFRIWEIPGECTTGKF
jgi:4-alpha-glucanotransferase